MFRKLRSNRFIYWLQDFDFKANDKALSKITLKEDTEMLDEVVVVGYGTVKKRDLTGSISSVNAQRLQMFL